MKATGIIRRIDDLGRVVIPKDIRRTMHIHEDDPLEIFIDTETDSVCFAKYHALGIENEALINVALDMAKASRVVIAIYNEDWRITQNSGNGIFPSDVPDEWRDRRNYFETDDLDVFPVISMGEFYGYVVGDRHDGIDLEICMIARYLAAAIEHGN